MILITRLVFSNKENKLWIADICLKGYGLALTNFKPSPSPPAPSTTSPRNFASYTNI